MKRIEAIFPAERLYNVSDELKKVGVGGLTVYDSKGRGQVPIQQRVAGRGGLFTPMFNTNCCVVVVVSDSKVEQVVQAILNSAGSGMAGEGKIFITNVDRAVDIGSKKSGDEVL